MEREKELSVIHVKVSAQRKGKDKKEREEIRELRRLAYMIKSG